MNRITFTLIFLCVTLGVSCNNDPRLVVPSVPNSATPSEEGDFAGSETCRTCHQSIWQSWSKTRHTDKVRNATTDVLVNDFDSSGTSDFEKGGTGVVFDVATSVPPNQTTFPTIQLGVGIEYPKLGFDGTNGVIRIGTRTYTVTYVLGGTGKWKQRYMVTIGNQEYISPVQFNDVTRAYVWYHPENWYTLNAAGDTLTGYLYDVDQTPVTEGNVRDSWQRRCIGCHVTGVRDITKNADGEFGATIADMIGSDAGPYFAEQPIACEACHGPSGRHVDLGGGIGTTINPDKMAADRGAEVCGSCHNRGTSTNAEGFGYPWKEDTLLEGQFRPGDVLVDFFTSVDRAGSRFWDNGARSAKSHREEFIEHEDSAHGRAGVTCWKCHDPHGSNIEGDLRMPVQTLCLSCHDGEGDIDAQNLSLHTRHADVRDCNECHLVGTAKSAVPGDIDSHVYRVIFPAESETTEGLPNSCGECHPAQTPAQLTSYLRTRWPDVKPAAYAFASPRISGGFTLLGSESLDPLGGSLTYEWTFVSGPPTFGADQLIAPTTDDAIFVPTNPGIYRFRLVVTNARGLRSGPALLDVDVAEGVPQNPPDLADSVYMGSTGCNICHSDVHDEWLTTRHKRTVRAASEADAFVFTDSNGNGIDDWEEGSDPPAFNLRTDPMAANTEWDSVAFGTGVDAPRIGMDATTGQRRVTIGNVTYNVSFAIGAGGLYDQEYLATSNEGEYVLALSYNAIARSWGVVTPEFWYDVASNTLTAYAYDTNETPVTEGRAADAFQARCLTCHTTGARDLSLNTATGERAFSLTRMLAATTGPRIAELGTGCESCHGPGSQHMTPSTGGTGSPSIRGAIINPAKLSSDRENETCAQCHSRGTSTNTASFPFPWDRTDSDGHYIPGRVLSDFFQLADETDTNVFWDEPGSRGRVKYTEWSDFRWSRHTTEGGMSCNDCHQPHKAANGAQLRMPENELCLRCHQSVVTDQTAIENHSRHGRNSVANRCSTCHMPKVATAAQENDLGSHLFRVLYPHTSNDVLTRTGETLPNSCMTAGCHSQSEGALPAWDPGVVADNDDATAQIRKLWGDLRPTAAPRFDSSGLRREANYTAPATINLDGSLSFDPNQTGTSESGIRSYTWTLVSAPPASSAMLLDRLSVRARLNVTEPGEYVFQLVVQDTTLASRAIRIVATVR